jgi:methyl-accepting chemotaxis protein
VKQMNRAMMQVEQVTHRNASAAEELSATAEELSAQAETLQQLVAFFRVGESEARPARPRATRGPVEPPGPGAAWSLAERPGPGAQGRPAVAPQSVPLHPVKDVGPAAEPPESGASSSALPAEDREFKRF